MMAAQLFQALPLFQNSLSSRKCCHKLSQEVDFRVSSQCVEARSLESSEVVCLVICYFLFENWRGFGGIVFLKDKTELFLSGNGVEEKARNFQHFRRLFIVHLFTKTVG